MIYLFFYCLSTILTELIQKRKHKDFTINRKIHFAWQNNQNDFYTMYYTVQICHCTPVLAATTEQWDLKNKQPDRKTMHWLIHHEFIPKQRRKVECFFTFSFFFLFSLFSTVTRVQHSLLEPERKVKSSFIHFSETWQANLFSEPSPPQCEI